MAGAGAQVDNRGRGKDVKSMRLRGDGVDAKRESAEQEQSGALFAVVHVHVVRVVVGGVVLVWDVGCVGGRGSVGV